MDIKTFKRYYNKEVGRMVKATTFAINSYKKRIEDLEKLKELITKDVVELNNYLSRKGFLDDDGHALAWKLELMTIEIVKLGVDLEKEGYESFKIEDIDNNYVNLPLKIQDMIDYIKTLLDEAEKILNTEKDRLTAFNRDDVVLESDLIGSISCITMFGFAYGMDFGDLKEIIGYVIHVNGNYILKNNITVDDELQQAFLDELVSLKDFFDDEGHIVKNVENKEDFERLELFLTALVEEFVDDEEFACKVKSGYKMIKDLESLLSRKESKKLKTKEDSRKEEEKKLIKAYENILKGYFKDGEIICECEVDEFRRILNEKVVREEDKKRLIKLMDDYVTNKCLERRSDILNKYFTQAEIDLYLNNVNNLDFDVRCVISDITSLIDLIGENEEIYEELKGDKEELFKNLKSILNIEDEDFGATIFLDDDFIPCVAKNFSKLDRSEKKKALTLIRNVGNGKVEHAKGVADSKHKRLYYLSLGKVRLCFIEYREGKNVIVSLGREDKAFDEVEKILESKKFFKFVRDLNDYEFYRKAIIIRDSFVEEESKKLESGKGLILKNN